MTNQEIIQSISNQIKIHIPLSKGYDKFSKGRLIGHLSYWISIATLQRGRHSKRFLDFWKNQKPEYHQGILILFEINIDAYEFENPDSKLDLGV
ncbi:hypothetical protein NIES4102_29410 [Chondrocystis sp. NIES-4102]|nr:hypothetical protein NIES4102_29410 [Chondrocystis sp. NIES-4102]